MLSDFSVQTTIDRVHVLAELPGRIWRPVADAPLGERPAGGRPREPAARAHRLRPARCGGRGAPLLRGGECGNPFAVTARRDDEVVAAAWGWSARGGLEVADLVVAAEHRGQGIGRHVLAAVVALAQRRECTLVGVSAPADRPGAALLAAAGFALVSQGEDASTSRGPSRWFRQA